MTEFDPKVYWESRLQNHFGLDGVGFLRLGRRYNAWLYKMRRTVFLRRMRALGIDFRDVDVLDVGSGVGFWLDRWRELGVRSVAGSDLTEVATKELRNRYPGSDIYQVDIGGSIAPLEGRRFQAVSAFDVLFHIVDDARYERAISNIYELVEPGGLFIFSDNLVHHDTVNYTHQVNRSLAYVEKVLAATGFEMVERRPMYVLMNGAPDTRNPLARWLWLAIAGTVSLGEPIGWLVGALLYPLERLLVGVLRESQSVEMVICRRPSPAA